MSDRNNEIWLEAARTNFEMAVAENNIPLAKDILEDMKDAGFGKEAKQLEELAAKDFLDAKNGVGDAKRMHYEG